MSWNIEKPGDRINGPVTITGNTTLTGYATISGDLTVDTSTLKVDSTNNRVGVGTASPSVPLDVVGNAKVSGDLVVDTNTFVVDSTNNRLGIGTESPAATVEVKTAGSAGSAYISADSNGGSFRASGHIQFYTDNAVYDTIWYKANKGSQNMRLTDDGNLGLGVTPSAWSGFKALQIARGSFTSFGVDTFLSHNWYWNGTQDTYIANDHTARYCQSQGKHIWENGGTSAGTAGAQITFSPKMTLDASGNLGVGVSAPSFRLDVGGQDGTNIVLRSTGTSSARFRGYVNGVESGVIGFLNGGGQFFETSGSEKMRLDANGRLLVAKNSSSTSSTGCELQTGSGGNSASVFTADGAFSSIMNRLTSDGIIVDLRRQTLSVGNISVTTTGATFNTTSDYRLKESVAPLSGGLARVNALKPSVFKWKSNGSDGEGFLAHELAEVVPFAVTGEKDAVNNDGTIKTQSVDMSRIVPILVAAIKELSAEVNALKNV